MSACVKSSAVPGSNKKKNRLVIFNIEYWWFEQRAMEMLVFLNDRKGLSQRKWK